MGPSLNILATSWTNGVKASWISRDDSVTCFMSWILWDCESSALWSSSHLWSCSSSILFSALLHTFDHVFTFVWNVLINLKRTYETVYVHHNNNHTHGHKIICTRQEYGNDTIHVHPTNMKIASQPKHSTVHKRIPKKILTLLQTFKLIESIFLNFDLGS